MTEASLSLSTVLPFAGPTNAVVKVTDSPLPIQVLTHPSADGFSVFFPFHDLASLNSGSQDLFSFKQLIKNGTEGQDLLILFTEGCEVDGKADCSKACRNETTFFSSLETFYNCIALSSISYWTKETNRYYISAEAERNASGIMGSSSLASFDGRPVLSSFVTCAQEACGADGLHKACDDSIKKLSHDANATVIFKAMDDFCPDIQAEINPDIFGPGVLISYVLQVAFSGSLYLVLKAFTLYVRYTHKKQEAQKQLQRASSRGGLTRRLTRIESMIWRDSSALSRTSIALATTLVEFQEAQCWFVFAIQIASILAIVVNSQEGTFWGEIIVNAAVAFHVSQNGILPMFLIQICLHHEGIRNWHTFLGFFVEYLLAIVATTQKVYFHDAFNLFKQENKIAACGQNPSPRSYCASTQGVEGLRLNFFPHPMLYKLVFLVLDTIAIVILVFDQLSWTLRTHRLTKHLTIGSYRVGRAPTNGRLKLAWVRFKQWVWRILEVIYLVVNVLYLISLVRVISVDSFQANKWSYGQIIAMTVWGPVIVKLFDLAVSGPPKNGQRLNSGPPRLRIDNVINRRHGTSADEELDAEDEAYGTGRERRIPAPPELDLRQRTRSTRDEEADLTDGISDVGGGDDVKRVMR
ncbi:hypothetical protein VFPPC_16032 [Pochonia chlamydosporia 170]|uniref:Uncharacterized protein n=1 Tax=Pochonia chlamydosporia 170 TaxID=1380566 RepID=A0A179FN55_METCM|nr:hypothetical protein VFPPC_16032 [Pochonia chlamydosporia 170]OAQ66449.1 hypothetical protein VFPPC_16032 [Pochonia chlamydosporia 170]